MRRTELVKHCLRNKNARRRGLGIEIALLVLLAAVALSALLVSSAMLERNSLKDRKAETLERLALDQIGEKYLAGKIVLNVGETTEYNGYKVTVKETGWMQVSAIDDELKLVVKTDGGKVTEWSYYNLGIGG